MSSRRRLIMSANAGGGGGIPADTPFVKVSEADTFLCKVEYRGFWKVADGDAWVALIMDDQDDHYCAPTLLARTPEACIRDPNADYPPVHVVVQGQDWYWSWNDWAIPIGDGWGEEMWWYIAENPLNLPFIGPKGTFYFDTNADNGVAAGEQLVRMLLGLEDMELWLPE